MAKEYVLDMTKGNVTNLLLRFTMPMLVGNIFQQFYNMVDSIIVGRFVGTNALGAVGSVGSITFMFFSLCLGLGSGIGILISQYFGAGQDDYVKKIIANALYITLATGALMSFCGAVFAEPILHFMHTPAENFADALTYMRIVCGFTVVVAGYNTISAILRALGDAKTPLIFLGVASVLNIVLDLVFVVPMQMGVAGAAWATVIAQFFAMLGSIAFGYKKNEYLRLEKRHMAYSGEIVEKSFRIGIPVAAQNALIAFSCVALQSVVNRYGTTVMAAYTATGRVEGLVQQPYNSLALAVSTFAGQNAGAGQYDRVRDGVKKSVWMVAIFSVLMIIVMWLFGEPIMRIFINEPEVIAIGAKGLRITSLMYFGLGLIYVMRGMLNGVGDAFFAMMNGVTEVIGRIGFAFLFMMIPSVGMWGVWYTNGLTWTLTGLVNVIRVLQGKWVTKAVVDREKDVQ
ncbi:MAG: MATE family efflux transporter [Lachnospiraceae bacterium]|nr:MATE family efflux transporter [Lachnospiraceae bacterium]